LIGALAGAVTIDPGTFIVGVAALAVVVGGGGAVGVAKWLKQTGARDSRVDEAADTVLGKNGREGMDSKLDKVVGAVAGIERTLEAFGGELHELKGHVAGQTEALEKRVARLERRPLGAGGGT
jgi:hypothetical protein